MSKIVKPGVLDETAKSILDELHTQNLLLNVIAGSGIETATSLAEISRIVKAGKADKVFNIGDQIIVPWTDKAANKTYDCPLNVVDFITATLMSGETVPAMLLQWNYATPFGVQFDGKEAFHVVPSGGYSANSTFHFEIPTAWSSSGTGDFQFTINVDLAEGAQFVFRTNIADNGALNAVIDVYADGKSTTVIDTCTITSGSSGTDLGELKLAGDTALNAIQCTVYGYNRWKQSGIRQWLNSAAAPDAWWASQNPYDRAPSELATKHGFMSGFSDEFLSILQPIKVSTAMNTVSTAKGDTDDLEDTYDTFFLPSLVEMHINPQKAGEGDIFDYWLRASQQSSPLSQGGTYPQIRTYAIENHSSAQNVRLRSAYRSYALNTWYVSSSGYVGGHYGYATYSDRCAPVCAVC